MLPRVLASLCAQEMKDFVWVLVNDAGDAAPVESIARQGRERGLEVNVINRKTSIGMEAASNHGVRESQSEYVVIHDDDDSWEPAFLRETVEYLDSEKDVPGVIAWANRVDEMIKDNGVEVVASYPYNHWLLNIYLSDMAIENRFPPISFLFRRSIYDEVGGFDESLPVLGDWDFHLRVLMKGDIHVIHKPLANYHFRVNSEKGDVYGNTVNAGMDQHVLYDAVYRNRKLREDLEAGSQGVGALLAMGQMLRPLNHLSNTVGRLGEVSRNNKVLSLMRKLVRL